MMGAFSPDERPQPIDDFAGAKRRIANQLQNGLQLRLLDLFVLQPVCAALGVVGDRGQGLVQLVSVLSRAI
jgi:hypothetical protein